MAKTLTGVVSSDKGDKTIVVTVATRKTHPLYKKQYTYSSKFMAHDESNIAKIGDKVLIAETRPLSARKRFILETVLEKAPIRHIETTEPLVVVEPATTKTVTKAKSTKKTEVSPAKLSSKVQEGKS